MTEPLQPRKKATSSKKKKKRKKGQTKLEAVIATQTKDVSLLFNFEQDEEHPNKDINNPNNLHNDTEKQQEQERETEHETEHEIEHERDQSGSFQEATMLELIQSYRELTTPTRTPVLLDNQVGGHVPFYKLNDKVCKPLAEGEKRFYESVSQNCPDLLPFVPRYYGTTTIASQYDEEDPLQQQEQEQQEQEQQQEQQYLQLQRQRQHNQRNHKQISHHQHRPSSPSSFTLEQEEEDADSSMDVSYTHGFKNTSNTSNTSSSVGPGVIVSGGGAVTSPFSSPPSSPPCSPPSSLSLTSLFLKG